MTLVSEANQALALLAVECQRTSTHYTRLPTTPSSPAIHRKTSLVYFSYAAANKQNDSNVWGGVFDDGAAINPFMDSALTVDITKAVSEHAILQKTLENLGVTVVNTPAPPHLQDGVYTANWALVRGDKAVLASLPPSRQGEQPYAKEALQNLGKKCTKYPPA
ncbi:hypothetical protein IPL68_03030 [Candidatus Saccharibacteria bacterium]|nr:MAG: hypothetical protein IPL68_03030 [Candidatus Saccharibacteria bacterium]